MFRSNTNIIGFLQKKQFFNRSPSPSPSPNSRFHTNPNPATPSKGNLTPPKPTGYDTNRSINAKTAALNRNIFELSRQNSVKAQTKRGQNTHRGDAEVLKKDMTAQKPLYGGQTTRSFQSSRVEVRMCIEQLGGRVSAELRQLQGAITELTASLQTIFYRKLGELRAQVSRSIDQVFAQARSDLNNLVTSTNQKHLKRLLKSKHQLAQADKKLKELKTTLDSNWRNAAAEMFSTNFDQRVDQLLEDSLQTRKVIGVGTNTERTAGVVMTDEGAAWAQISRGVQRLIQRKCR